MSGPLRRVLPKLQSVGQSSSNVGLQRRAAGDLPYKPNKYIEEWGTYKENLEHTFKFDGKTLIRLGLAGVVFPYFLYTNIVDEFHKVDKIAGRKPREFM